jgi:hypothetical protein
MRNLPQTEKDEQINLKRQYINEQIIAKGYNPEELYNYIYNKRGLPFDNLLLADFQKVVEQFKNEQLSQRYITMQVSKEKDKPKSAIEIYYGADSYEIKCAKQEKTPLSAFKSIIITVSSPEKKEGGFFSSTQYSYLIECPEIAVKTRRTDQDIDWLKNKLTEYHPYEIVPPLLKYQLLYNSEQNLQINIRYINKFFGALTQKKIFRNSPILFNFLALSPEEFNKYKNNLNQKPYTIDTSLANYISTKDTIKFEINPTLALKGKNLINKTISPIITLHSEIQSAFDSLVSDFNSMNKHFKEISNLFSLMTKALKSTSQDETLPTVYESLARLCEDWSTSYLKQSKLFSEDMKEFFNFMHLEFSEFHRFGTEFENMKRHYETTKQKLQTKKEYLYNSKKYDKWELSPELGVDPKLLEKNKDAAMDAICYKESLEVNLIKRKFGLLIHMMDHQYKKVIIHQGKRAKSFFEYLAVNKNDLLGDAFNLLKLLSLKI